MNCTYGVRDHWLNIASNIYLHPSQYSLARKFRVVRVNTVVLVTSCSHLNVHQKIMRLTPASESHGPARINSEYLALDSGDSGYSFDFHELNAN